MTSSTAPRILVYLLRRDLRLADNPVFHEISRLSKAKEPSVSFTHVLPIYVFSATQIEVSGFLTPNEDGSLPTSPYPEARSQIGRYWRCGKHRAKFLAESVWDLKSSLEKVGSGLEIQVGTVRDVLSSILEWYSPKTPPVSLSRRDSAHDVKGEVVGLWLTEEDGVEERREEREARNLAKDHNLDFKLVKDEKYYIDDRDLPFKDISDLPDIYTSFRKSVEPLRERPRGVLTTPDQLPPLPRSIPQQNGPFTIPSSYSDLVSALLRPLDKKPDLARNVKWPNGTKSAHPFTGGEKSARDRVLHLLKSGSMTAYKDTRNGMVGEDYSTKLSAWLAVGCLTARQIHHAMVEFEDGRIPLNEKGSTEEWEAVAGYGKGESKGTAAVRFELLWRDYMRLCNRKFGTRLFHIDGFRADATQSNGQDGEAKAHKQWRYLDNSQKHSDNQTISRAYLERLLYGETGIGLIDASQRELLLTGYTSNRARQNVASFFASHLNLDWRLGAEWYESVLVDYDVASNWGNWQYVAGVGNDPRQGRIFNPVKQALDYDDQGHFIKAWVDELKDVDLKKDEEDIVDREKLMGLFQAWRLPTTEKQRLGIEGAESVEDPMVRIPFSISRKKPDGAHGEKLNRRGGGRGQRWSRGRGRGRGGADGIERSEGRPRRMGAMDKANIAQS